MDRPTGHSILVPRAAVMLRVFCGQACFERIGYLNLFTPLEPDGEYRLDLASFEERQVPDMLPRRSLELWACETRAVPGGIGC